MKNTPDQYIEIEYRAILDRKKFKQLKKFLARNAQDLGSNNKNVYFYLLPNRIVKVAHNVSKDNAEIVMKLNRLGKGRSDFEEIIIPFSPADFHKARRLFSLLPFTEVQHSYQRRHDYMYKGVSLALKYTASWKYHLELEVMVKRKSQYQAAAERIKEIAKELQVKILSGKELTKFAKEIDQNYKKGLYK